LLALQVPFVAAPRNRADPREQDAAAARDELCSAKPASATCRQPVQSGTGNPAPAKGGHMAWVAGWQGGILTREAELEALKVQLDKTPVLTLPLNMSNILAIAVLLVLCGLGCVFIFKLLFRRKCNCKLCSGDYALLQSVGTGGYGQVFTVKRYTDGMTLVLKKISVEDITDANFAQAEARELRALQHPRVVAYEDDFVHVEWPQISSGVSNAVELQPQHYLMIVMEFCPDGDLCGRIASLFNRSISSSEEEDEDEEDLEPLGDAPDSDEPVIPELQVLTWLGQMADALAFVHSHNIIHRDIKSQNFFLTESGDIRLGDFGLCRKALAQTITVGGTDVYMAPEMVLGKRYGKEADIWALGCVLFEMCTGKFMWEIPGILGAQAGANADAIDNLLKVLPGGYSPGMRRLLGQMLDISSANRPTASAICHDTLVCLHLASMRI
jgi:serine/threonine protein kinase